MAALRDDLYFDDKSNYILAKQDMWKIKLIKSYPYEHFLDIGAGSGRWLDMFPGWQGIDIDSRALNNPRVKKGTAVRIPFRNRTFDGALASHVLEHIPRKQFDSAINEIYRVIKPGGVLVVFGPNPSRPEFYSDFTHVNPINISSLSNLLEHHGFSILESDYSFYKRHPIMRLLPKTVLHNIFPMFLTEFYLVAKKK